MQKATLLCDSDYHGLYTNSMFVRLLIYHFLLLRNDFFSFCLIKEKKKSEKFPILFHFYQFVAERCWLVHILKFEKMKHIVKQNVIKPRKS